MFAGRGARLALLDRDATVEAAAGALPGTGHVPLVVDVTDTDALQQAVATVLERLIPRRRFAQPAEIAMAALYLASGGAGMVNGENLVVDGGYTIQ